MAEPDGESQRHRAIADRNTELRRRREELTAATAATLERAQARAHAAHLRAMQAHPRMTGTPELDTERQDRR